MNNRITVITESGTPDIKVQLSPHNKKEDDSSEPKINLSLRPSTYTDMVFVSVLSDKDPEEVMADFRFQVTKDGHLELSVVDEFGTNEHMLYVVEVERIKKGYVI